MRRTEDSGAVTLSAEKGYSREAGNLLFHVALLVSLVLIGVGQLYHYEGTRILTQGNGFCNTIAQYDDWRPGRFAADGRVTPGKFCIDRLNKFTAVYSSNDEPREFRADITYRPALNSAPRHDALRVNHPLRLDGDRVYLISHGFAPTVTVHMPDGSTRTVTQAFLPTDTSTLYSEGAFKLLGKPGAKQDVGISGFFAPTPVQTAPGIYTSSSRPPAPRARHVRLHRLDQPQRRPAVGVLAGPDPKNLTKIGAANLRVGQTKTFPNGVAVTFDGWKPWVSLQVSHDPTQGWLLLGAAAMVIGLACRWAYAAAGSGSGSAAT